MDKKIMVLFKKEDRVQLKGQLKIWHIKRINADDTLLLSERDLYGNFFGRLLIARNEELKMFIP